MPIQFIMVALLPLQPSPQYHLTLDLTVGPRPWHPLSLKTEIWITCDCWAAPEHISFCNVLKRIIRRVSTHTVESETVVTDIVDISTFQVKPSLKCDA